MTGKRKQSISDAEKLLSIAVANWCKENGFPKEGRVVEIIANWHKASDGRGLDEETRRKYNLGMLDFLLEDWMPWYQEKNDYATLDPNRFAQVSLTDLEVTMYNNHVQAPGDDFFEVLLV